MQHEVVSSNGFHTAVYTLCYASQQACVGETAVHTRAKQGCLSDFQVKMLCLDDHENTRMPQFVQNVCALVTFNTHVDSSSKATTRSPHDVLSKAHMDMLQQCPPSVRGVCEHACQQVYASGLQGGQDVSQVASTPAGERIPVVWQPAHTWPGALIWGCHHLENLVQLVNLLCKTGRQDTEVTCLGSVGTVTSL